MQQKLSSDLSFVFSGSLKSAQLPEHLKLANDIRGRKAVVSVASASRDTFVVVRLHRLLRSNETYRRSASVAALDDEQKRL